MLWPSYVKQACMRSEDTLHGASLTKVAMTALNPLPLMEI